MKAVILIIIVLGIWLAYKRHEQPLAGARTFRRRPMRQGVIPTTSRNFAGATGNVARSGNSSPGNGIPAIQPPLASTWANAGGFNVGGVGVSYR